MVKKKIETAIFHFPGRLTIHFIAEIKAKLQAAFDSADSLLLELPAEVEAVDLSFFQLLCSLHRAALKEKKSVTLKQPVHPVVRNMMAGIGYERKVSCTEEGEDTCFFKLITEGAPVNSSAPVVL